MKANGIQVGSPVPRSGTARMFKQDSRSDAAGVKLFGVWASGQTNSSGDQDEQDKAKALVLALTGRSIPKLECRSHTVLLPHVDAFRKDCPEDPRGV